MAAGSGTDLDCKEFLSNLIDPSEAIPGNNTLCEEYFSSLITEVSPLLQNDNITNDVTELPETFGLMEEISEAVETTTLVPDMDTEFVDLGVDSNLVTSTEIPLEDVNIEFPYVTSVSEVLSSEKDFGLPTTTEIISEVFINETEVLRSENDFGIPTTTEVLSDIFSNKTGILGVEGELPETTTTKILTTIMSQDEGILGLDSGLPDTTTADFLTTIMADDKESFVNALNETWLPTTTEIIEDLISNGTDLKTPDLGQVNLSLCEWYLPTINQTPHALGNTGIALWVLGFVITLCLIGMFAKQAYFIYTTAHKSFRRHLYSITSIYVVMALLTSIGSGIPRAHAVCSGMKDVYMSIGIGHFVDLTIAMYGGENVMFWYVKDKLINIRVIPICKCFFCIPICKTKRISVSILKWIVWQMKWSQAIYYLLKLIWIKSLENSIGVVSRNDSSFWYMHILNVASFLSGVMSLIIIGSLVRDDLEEKYKYTIKTKLVRFTILTTKLQRLLFEILEAFNVFPCYPPYVSQKFYKNVLKDFIYLLEVLLLGGITFFVYNKRGEFETGNSSEVPQPMLQKENEPLEENGFPLEDDVSVPLNYKDPGDSNC